jgi:hypothetical protein
MNADFISATSCVALLLGTCLAAPAMAQTTLFSTEDFRQDRALWTDPDYYLNNTVGQLSGMAIDFDAGGVGTGQEAAARAYGTPGTGESGATNFATPYSYPTAWEHYQAWLTEAGAPTQHTMETLPNWDGVWNMSGGFDPGDSPASDIVAYLTPEYQEHMVQDLKATVEGRLWWAGAFCLPRGFLAAVESSPMEFYVRPGTVLAVGSTFTEMPVRWIYTDGSGHPPEDRQFSKWHGESIGFWDEDTLIVHTNQIKGWKGGISEFSDNLESVERYRRVGDVIEGEITLYDPAVFSQPVHAAITFEREANPAPELRALYNTCTDTNGPSIKVYMDDRGILNERLPGEELYFSAADPRPWQTWLDESDRRYRAYLDAGGEGRTP